MKLSILDMMLLSGPKMQRGMMFKTSLFPGPGNQLKELPWKQKSKKCRMLFIQGDVVTSRICSPKLLTIDNYHPVIRWLQLRKVDWWIKCCRCLVGCASGEKQRSAHLLHHPLFKAALLLVLSWSSFFCLSRPSLSTHMFYILAVIVKTAHFRHSLLSSAHPRHICPEQQQPSWFLSLFFIPHINMTMWDSNYVITDVAVFTLQQCSFLPLPSF